VIKGKAKMEFGTGDIRMTAVLSEGTGALCCITQEPHKINERVPVGDGWNADDAQVIMTFTKKASIDALIAELTDVGRMMEGSYPLNERLQHSLGIDLDKFLKEDKSYIKLIDHDKPLLKNNEHLKEILKVQGCDGTWNYNNYSLGLYNGMELMMATIEHREPVYRGCEDKDFLWNKENNTKPVRVGVTDEYGY